MDQPRDDVFMFGDSHIEIIEYGMRALGANPHRFRLKPVLLGYMLDDCEMFPKKREAHKLTRRALKAQKSPSFEELTSGKYTVIASFGFGLGKLLGRTSGQGISLLESAAPQKTSRAFMRAFTYDLRKRELDWIERNAPKISLTMIPPPRITTDPTFTYFYNTLLEMMRERGANIFDPSVHLASRAGVIPRALLRPDGFHGNHLYGVEVAKLLIQCQIYPTANTSIKQQGPHDEHPL